MFHPVTKFIFPIVFLPMLATCGPTELTTKNVEQILSDGDVTFIAVISADGLTVQGPNTIQLNVSNESGGIVNASIGAIPTMPGHGGHGTSETPLVTEVGNGDYEITNLVFTMPGTWQIELLAQFGDDSIASVSLFYTVL